MRGTLPNTGQPRILHSVYRDSGPSVPHLSLFQLLTYFLVYFLVFCPHIGSAVLKRAKVGFSGLESQQCQ